MHSYLALSLFKSIDFIYIFGIYLFVCLFRGNVRASVQAEVSFHLLLCDFQGQIQT